MAASRSRIRQHPTDVWSLRERLSLGCSVMRSGDQNWVSVSRAIKPYGEPNRPSDWFSQKNCALQYSELLEKVETPKRKRGEREATETPGDVIVRKLTIERIEELKRIVQEEQEKYKKLKKEVEEIQSGTADDRLQDVLVEMEEEKLAKEEKDRKEAEEIATRRTPQKKKPHVMIKHDMDESTQDSVMSDANMTEDESTMSAAPSVSTTPQPMIEEIKVTESIPEQTVVTSTPAPVTEIVVTEPEPVSVEANPETTTEIIPKIEIKEEPVDVEIESEPVVVVEPKIEVESSEEREERTTRSSSKTDAVVKQGVPTLTRLLGNPPASAALSSPAPSAAQSSTKIKGSANVSPNAKGKASGKSPIAKSKAHQSPASKVKPTEETQLESHVSTRSSTVAEPVELEKKESKVRDRTPSRDRKKKKVPTEDEQSLQDEGTDTENVPKTPVDIEEPPSPASSVISTETDSGSTRGKGRRSSRGGKGGHKPGRRSTRVTRSKLTVDEEKKDEDLSSKQSEQETSDDEGHQESDDTSSVLTSSRGHGARSIIESQPNSPAGSLTHGSDTEDEKAHKIWKKSIMLVWRAAANHKYANVFSHPVTDEIAPGYSSVVFRPMDLLTIKKSIEAGALRTTVEFQRDMMLMFTNAIMYNNSDHDVYNMATEMYDDVMVHIEQFVNTQMMVQAEPKILRASRRSEVLSDKEEANEPKRKRTTTTSETPEHHRDGGKSKKRKNVS